MKHIVKLTISNPSHEHVSLRSRTKQQDYISEGRDESEAINRATRHFRALGFKVHSAVIIEQKAELPDPVSLSEAVDYKALEKPTAARIKSGETKLPPRTNYDIPPAMRKKPVDKKAALEAFIARRKQTVTEEAAPQYIEEKLTAADPASKWIHDFVHSDNPKFAGKSKEERIKMALGAKYAAQRNEEVEQIMEGDLSIRTLYNKWAGHYTSSEGNSAQRADAVEKTITKVHGPVVMNHLKKAIKANLRNDMDQEENHFERARNAAEKSGSDRVNATVGRNRSNFRKEEVEQIDELDRKTRVSYLKKSLTQLNNIASSRHTTGNKTYGSKEVGKRLAGLSRFERSGNHSASVRDNIDAARAQFSAKYFKYKKPKQVAEEAEQTDEARKMSRIEWRTGTPDDVAKNHQKIYKKLSATDPEKAEKFLKSVKGMKKEVQEEVEQVDEASKNLRFDPEAALQTTAPVVKNWQKAQSGDPRAKAAWSKHVRRIQKVDTSMSKKDIEDHMKSNFGEEVEQIEENPAIIAAMAGELLGGAAEGLAARAGAGAITRSIARKAGQTVGSKLVNKKDQQANEAADPGETKVVNKAVKTKKASAAAERMVKIAKSKVNKINMDPKLDHDVKQSSRY